MSVGAQAASAEPLAPNTGRILDYWLGGSHHYPIDVIGARQFESVYDGFPEVFKALRGYIGRAARHIESKGIDQFLVLGAGLPTRGNVHEAVPDSRVLYTDIDNDNVTLGLEILAGNPNATYAYCDATDMSTLDPDVVAEMIDMKRPVGLVFIGATAFMPEEILRKVMRELYDWAPAGSVLALDFDGEALTNHPKALELLSQIGAKLHTRHPAIIQPLLTPWTLCAPGILPAATWPDGPGARVSPKDVFMFGCVVEKTNGSRGGE